MRAPTLAGFLAFIRGEMGITHRQLPDGSPSIADAFNVALEITNDALAGLAPMIYSTMVYNLAGDALINFGVDTPPSKFFAGQRASFKIGDFKAGVVQSTSDESDSTSLMVPDVYKSMTLAEIEYLKTPWGRRYLNLAQRYGSTWGIS